MDVSKPKFEISMPGLLRKCQTILSPLLFSRKQSLPLLQIGFRLISFPIENVWEYFVHIYKYLGMSTEIFKLF